MHCQQKKETTTKQLLQQKQQRQQQHHRYIAITAIAVINCMWQLKVIDKLQQCDSRVVAAAILATNNAIAARDVAAEAHR